MTANMCSSEKTKEKRFSDFFLVGENLNLLATCTHEWREESKPHARTNGERRAGPMHARMASGEQTPCTEESRLHASTADEDTDLNLAPEEKEGAEERQQTAEVNRRCLRVKRAMHVDA